jgi:hypothetical protein
MPRKNPKPVDFAKLSRAYGLLLAYDRDYGNNETLQEVAELIAVVIGPRRANRRISQIEKEFGE